MSESALLLQKYDKTYFEDISTILCEKGGKVKDTKLKNLFEKVIMSARL